MIINWISVALVILILVVWFRRIIISVQQTIEIATKYSQSFQQRKLEYVKQAEQGKHVSALLLLSIFGNGIVTDHIRVISSGGSKLHIVTLNRVNQLKDEAIHVKKNKTKLLRKLPIVKAIPKRAWIKRLSVG